MMTSSVLDNQIPSFYPPSNSWNLTRAFLKYHRSQMVLPQILLLNPLALCMELDLPIALPKSIWSDSDGIGTLFTSLHYVCLSSHVNFGKSNMY